MLLVIGTLSVAAAKRALGDLHTFTGQHLAEPHRLVTGGVYAFTRNPLYLGVLLCEPGALLFTVHQAPLLLPLGYPWWFGALGVALGYAMSFNIMMARREARALERCFGDHYRRYRATVPFLLPFSWVGSEPER